MRKKLYIIIDPQNNDIYTGATLKNTEDGHHGITAIEHVLGFYDGFEYSCIVPYQLSEYLPEDSIKLYMNFIFFPMLAKDCWVTDRLVDRVNNDKNSYYWIYDPHESTIQVDTLSIMNQLGIRKEKIIYTNCNSLINNETAAEFMCVNCAEWWEAQYRYNLKLFTDVSVIHPSQKYKTIDSANKKMMSLNRNIKGHRSWWYHKLLMSPLINESYVSYRLPYVQQQENISNSEFLDTISLYMRNEGIPQADISMVRSNPQILIDRPLDQLDAHYIINYRDTILPYYNDSLFSIVTESFYSEIFLTEKIFKAIVHCHPFILVGNPAMIRELQRRGYKTYNDMFGINTIDINNIDTVLQYLSSMTVDECAQLVKKNWNIVEYNWNHFFSRTISWKAVENAILKAVL